MFAKCSFLYLRCQKNINYLIVISAICDRPTEKGFNNLAKIKLVLVTQKYLNSGVIVKHV